MATVMSRQMSSEQQQLLSICRRSYRDHSCEPEEYRMEKYYPIFQPEHDRVLLISSESHPSIVAVAYFQRDGTPIHFEDWRSDETFGGLA